MDIQLVSIFSTTVSVLEDRGTFRCNPTRPLTQKRTLTPPTGAA